MQLRIKLFQKGDKFTDPVVTVIVVEGQSKIRFIFWD